MVCLVLARARATDEATGESSKNDSCYKSDVSGYGALFMEAFTFKQDVHDVDIFINCMSFDERKGLSAAVVSGNSTAGAEVLRFTCKRNTLLALESGRQFSTEENVACLECATESTTGDACVTPCADDCERCYGTADKCDCSNRVYNVEKVIEVVEDLEIDEHDIEATIEEVILKHSNCASECPEHYGPDKHRGNPHICHPCGVQFCAECIDDECEKCLPHTKLYEHEECVYGLREEILEVAEEQEKEVEKEEKEKELTRLELAITLPIVCVAVVAFFIFMSFVAHKRYPHIGETGKTRHRNKPSEAPEDDDVAIDNSVFRPRPTVRLR
jgi:hypothetical protein